MKETEQFEARKRDHIRHALNSAHQAFGLSGLSRIHLFHDALPELDFEEIGLDSPCLGGALPTPFYVAGMTAGHPDAAELNLRLATACAERGWAMGVGSQRRELSYEGPGVEGDIGADAGVDRWKQLRERVPNLVCIANLGISQLIDAPLEKVERLIEGLGAKALAVHTNPLQEALQPEGTPRFRGAIEALMRAASELSVPLVLKETGCGFAPATLIKLDQLRNNCRSKSARGLAAIDISGLGGTHWGRIEGARSEKGSLQERAARTFEDWGESTVESLTAAREVLPEMEIWASGGVRSGLDAAKLIALGATRVGYAKPALEAALEGLDSLRSWMQLQEYELKIALFCTGCRTPEDLRRKEKAWKVSAR